MRLYSYVVRHDTGFAPNPFFGYCTLACCKPAIRRTAEVGDWIVGLAPKAAGHKVIYFMKVKEKVTFDVYWSAPRFHSKQPRYGAEAVWQEGDNIYEALPGGRYRQHRSRHSAGACEDRKKMKRDLRGKYVLISKTFTYFGSRAKSLPDNLTDLVVQRGHKCRFSEDVIARFRRYTRRFGRGVHAAPTRWPKDDQSWAEASGRRRRTR